MGINIGAVMAPLVCGWLAESAAFKSLRTLVRLYGGIAAMLIVGAAVLAIVAPKIERMAGTSSVPTA